jgi:hypothetical protein
VSGISPANFDPETGMTVPIDQCILDQRIEALTNICFERIGPDILLDSDPLHDSKWYAPLGM